MHLFQEPVLAAVQVEAQLGFLSNTNGQQTFTNIVPEQHFQAVKVMLDSNPAWSETSSPEWMTHVVYKCPANRADSNEEPVSVYYKADPRHVKCARLNTLTQPVYWTSKERHLEVQVCQKHEVDAMPPESGTRYSHISITRYKDYCRESTAHKGIRWIYKLEKTWTAMCTRDAYQALPTHHVSIIMQRDQTDAGYNPTTTSGQQGSLAENLFGKALDICVQPATLQLLQRKVETQ